MKIRLTRSAGAELLVLVAALLVVALGIGGVPAAAKDFRQPAHLVIDVLTDPADTITIDNVRSESVGRRFTPLRGNSISLGYTREITWLRLTISALEDREMLVSLTPNFVDILDVYVFSSDGSPQEPVHYAMGDHRPLSDDALSGLDNVVPVELKGGGVTEVYVRAQAVNSVMTLQVSLYSPADHTYRTTVSSLASGSWFGGMIILLTIQLIFFYYNRMPAFAYLAVATFFAMMAYFGTLGLSRIFLFPSGGTGNDMFTAITSWLGITASALATRLILELPGRAVLVDRILLASAIIGVVGSGLSLAGHNMLFAPFAQATIGFVATAVALHTARTLEPNTGSRLRAAAFLTLWLGLMVTMAQRSGLFPLPDWVAHSYAVSSVVHAVLLTGALAVRLRAAELANARMREEALIAARNAEGRAMRFVEERTSDLARAKQVAEDALAAELASKEQQVRFMEVISHQYRTPLAAIQTHIANIGISLPQDDSANRRRLDRIRKAIARLVEVLEVNLTRSRLQGSAFKPWLEALQAGSMLEAAAARARDLLQIEIKCTIAPEARRERIEADADMLEIAIINLLENAAKFSDPGAMDSISLTATVTDAALIVEVSDRGRGISKEELPRLTEHGFRASNAANVPGTGTGLSLVARIAAAHRGKVEIDSILGAV